MRRWRLFFLLFISAPAYCYPDTFSHRQVGPQTLLGTCPRRSIVSAPTGAPPEARLNMEGMENIGFKARNGGRWRPGGGRRLEVGAQPQRDAVRVRRTKRRPMQLFLSYPWYWFPWPAGSYYSLRRRHVTCPVEGQGPGGPKHYLWSWHWHLAASRCPCQAAAISRRGGHACPWCTFLVCPAARTPVCTRTPRPVHCYSAPPELRLDGPDLACALLTISRDLFLACALLAFHEKCLLLWTPRFR